MNKIESFNLRPLHNSEHFQFMSEVSAAIAAVTAPTLGLTEAYPLFQTALAKEDASLKIEQGSIKSKLVQNRDILRDHTLESVQLRIASALMSPFTEEVESGKVLKHIFDTYGDIRNHPNNAESGEMTNMLDDFLKPENATHLQNVNLTRLVPELKKENTDFGTVTKERNTELSARESRNVTLIRAEVDPLYRTITDTINATITLKTAKPEAEIFVNELNMRIKAYKTTLAARETKNKNKDKGKDKDTEK